MRISIDFTVFSLVYTTKVNGLVVLFCCIW